MSGGLRDKKGFLVVLHPLFLVIIAFSMWIGWGLYILVSILAVLVHESAHSMVARRFGIRTERITLLPFGAEICIDCEFLPRFKRFLILVAGPMSNLGCAIVAVFAVICAGGSGFWEMILWANLAVGGLNLMPIWPLDGGKMVVLLGGKWGVSGGKRGKSGGQNGGFGVIKRWSNLVFVVVGILGAVNGSWWIVFFVLCMLLNINLETKNEYQRLLTIYKEYNYNYGSGEKTNQARARY